MTEARGLFYSSMIVVAVIALLAAGAFVARRAIWGCSSYTVAVRPDGALWACYVDDDVDCELVCAPLGAFLRRLQQQQQKDESL